MGEDAIEGASPKGVEGVEEREISPGDDLSTRRILDHHILEVGRQNIGSDIDDLTGARRGGDKSNGGRIDVRLDDGIGPEEVGRGVEAFSDDLAIAEVMLASPSRCGRSHSTIEGARREEGRIIDWRSGGDWRFGIEIEGGMIDIIESRRLLLAIDEEVNPPQGSGGSDSRIAPEGRREGAIRL